MEPTRLGPYTIRHRIGRGGMGTVYEAEDAAGRLVAVKTLAAHLGDDTGVRRRFEAEIEALKGLRHPGIVRLLAFGEDDGVPFFAMERVPGRSLEEILRAGHTYTWRETVAIAGEIVRALKAAHDQGVVHRDLKPANLLVDEIPGAPTRVRLADFGIARLFGDAGQTQAGTVVGTAEYMAPEQAMGGPVDHRVDLYALGLVMYAMLTGRPPFRGGEVADVLRRQRREPPPPASAIASGVPTAVDELIAKLLSKDPGDRPASALAVGRLLAAVEHEPDPVPPAAGRGVDGRPDDPPAGEAAGRQRPTGLDLLAATRATDVAGPPRADTRRSAAHADGAAGLGPTLPLAPATAAGPGSLAHRPTQPAGGPPRPPGPAATRFTTVEELDRSQRDRSVRQRRRDGGARLALAAAILAVVAATGYLVSRPASADALYARITAIAEDPAADLRDAAGLIDAFLARHAGDPRAAAIRGYRRRLDLDALERQARRRPRQDAVPGPLERDYRAAIAREQESPLACLTALEAILAVHPTGPDGGGSGGDESLWLDLVRRHIDRLAPRAARERQEDAERAEAALAEAATLAAEADAAGDPAARETLLARRRELLAALVEMHANRPHVADAVSRARRLLQAP